MASGVKTVQLTPEQVNEIIDTFNAEIAKAQFQQEGWKPNSSPYRKIQSEIDLYQSIVKAMEAK